MTLVLLSPTSWVRAGFTHGDVREANLILMQLVLD